MNPVGVKGASTPPSVAEPPALPPAEPPALPPAVPPALFPPAAPPALPPAEPPALPPAAPPALPPAEPPALPPAVPPALFPPAAPPALPPAGPPALFPPAAPPAVIAAAQACSRQTFVPSQDSHAAPPWPHAVRAVPVVQAPSAQQPSAQFEGPHGSRGQAVTTRLTATTSARRIIGRVVYPARGASARSGRLAVRHLQPWLRVDRLPLLANLEVQVRALEAAGVAHRANRLTLVHLGADLDLRG